jgi:hypothetical protein
MKLLRFEGYSDDTFACTGPGIDVDFDTCASGAPVYMRVEALNESMIVCGQYAPGPVAGWIIGVGPDDGETDDKPIPTWRVCTVRSGRDYSPLLLIEAPDDVKVSLIDHKGRAQPTIPAERDALVADLRRENDALREETNGWRRKAASVAYDLTRMAAGRAP